MPDVKMSEFTAVTEVKEGDVISVISSDSEGNKTNVNIAVSDLLKKMIVVTADDAAFTVDVNLFNGREGVIKIPDTITDPVVLTFDNLETIIPGTRITVCSLTEYTTSNPELEGLQGGGSGTIETLTLTRYPDDTVGSGDWVQTM